MEAVILIIIMSIVLTIGSVRMPSVDLFKTISFSSVLLSDLRLTKSLSMSKNQQYRLVIGASSYQIRDETGVAFTSALAYPSGVSINPTTTIVFDSLGKPYNSSGTALSSTLSLTVSSTGASQVVSVTPETGFIQ